MLEVKVPESASNNGKSQKSKVPVSPAEAITPQTLKSVRDNFMTPEQMQKSSQNKLAQIQNLMTLLHLKVDARQRVNPQGFIENVVFWTDDEKYPVEPAKVEGPEGVEPPAEDPKAEPKAEEETPELPFVDEAPAADPVAE